MNQKFKLGEKVVIKKTGNTITINRIDCRNGKLLYQDAYEDYELEPYQEPKVKKLYAYRNRGRDFLIQLHGAELLESVADVNYLERVPEYDITYPEEK